MTPASLSLITDRLMLPSIIPYTVRHTTLGTRLLLATAVLLSAACGEKAQDTVDAAKVSGAVVAAAANGSMEKAANDAAAFQADRRKRGDTVAMNYTALQKLLPPSINGYTLAEEPSGSSQSMGAFSMSEAEQRYTAPANSNGSTPTITVKLVDFGGTEGAYGMFALPMMMNISREDAHSRMRTLALGPDHTWASEEFNKDSKDAHVTAITRYRYVVTVEASNQADDQSDMVKKLTEQIVRGFAGK